MGQQTQGNQTQKDGLLDQAASLLVAPELVAKWVPIQVKGRPAQMLGWQSARDSLDSNNFLASLCGENPGASNSWPEDTPTLSLGQNFIGSATNWRGIQKAGLCWFAAAHVQYLPSTARLSNTSIELGALQHTHALFGASRFQLLREGVPQAWVAGLMQASRREVTRQFSYCVALPKAVVGRGGVVYSKSAIIAGDACGDMKHSFCDHKEPFWGRKKIQASTLATYNANTNESHAGLAAEWPVGVPSPFARAVELAKQNSSTTYLIPLNTRWSRTFYHWFTQVIPRLWSILHWIQKTPSVKLLVASKSTEFMDETLSILGINSDRLVEADDHDFVAADWVLVPAGTGCTNQILGAELTSFASYVTAMSLERFKGSARASESMWLNLPKGLVVEATAFSILAQAALHWSPNQETILQLHASTRQKSWETSSSTTQYGKLHQPVETAQLKMRKRSSSIMWKKLGSTHGDTLCDEQLDDVGYRSLPGIRISPSEAAKVESALLTNYTAAIAGLDAICSQRKQNGHRLVLFLKRPPRHERKLLNHDDVKLWLVNQLKGPVTVVVVTAHSMLEQSVLFRCADLIVAAHGSGLASLAFARKGAKVIEILPGAKPSPPCFFQLALLKGIQHTAVFGRRQGHFMTLSWKALRAGLLE